MQIAFDLSYLIENYGSGTAVLAVKRSQDTSAYPAVVTQEDATLLWTVNETDTAYVGSGECQLMWYVDGGLAKTIIYPMVVMKDILQTTEEPPDGYENWIEHLTELGAETQQNAQEAKQSATEAKSSEDSAAESAQRAEDAAGMLVNVSATATTLNPGQPATAEYDDGVFKFGIPKGDKLTYADLTEADKEDLVQGPIKDAQDDAVEAVGTAKTNAVDAVNQAGTTQKNAVNQAGTTQKNAVTQEGTTQVNTVREAGTTQVGRVTTEGNTQVGRVQDKGNEVIASIPSDYSDLTAEVDDLSRQLSDLGDVEGFKTAILQLAQKVAYVDDNGEKYYRDLHNAFYLPIAISVAFAQGSRTIFSNAELDSLKEFITVTATYADGYETVLNASEYDLNGELTAGTSTVTATAGNATSTFDVIVTEFSIPSEYTRYGYIQKKTTSTSQVAKSSFIILNDQQDMNVLNLEAYVAQKGNTNVNTAFFGARNDDYEHSYSVYDQGVGLFGVAFGTRFSTNYHVPASSVMATKVEYIRDSETTAFVRINGDVVKQLSVNNPVIIPHGFSLFNNFPYDTTSKFYINEQVRIGEIILRKMDGECVGYYVPVVYSGKIGMYDIVSESFYTAATASVVTISNSGCLYSVGNW
jgi:hypothetical protein